MASLKSRIPINTKRPSVKRQRSNTQDTIHRDKKNTSVLLNTTKNVVRKGTKPKYTFSNPENSKLRTKTTSTVTTRSRIPSGSGHSTTVSNGDVCKTRFQNTIDTKFGLKPHEKEIVKRFIAKPRTVMGYTELKKAEEELRKRCEKLEQELKNRQDQELQEEQTAKEKLTQMKSEQEQRSSLEGKLSICEKMVLLCQIDPVSLKVCQPSLDEMMVLTQKKNKQMDRATSLKEKLIESNSSSKNIIENTQKLLDSLE